MNTYEMTLIEITTVKIRVNGNTKEEAEKNFQEFKKKDPEYLAEELDLNGAKQWAQTEFRECNPDIWDEAATITKNEDGTFDAVYKGGYYD